MRDVRVAVVGCGAVAELVHLPSLATIQGVTASTLVDRDLGRARALAQRFGIPSVTDDHRQVAEQADAAIVAVPHDLHAQMSLDLLERGVHVLVEKPMALSTTDCDRMIQAADRSGRVLAVGLLRRFHDSLRFAKEVLTAEALGEITRLDLREGSVYSWRVTTDAMFKPPAGGVLADAGVHVLDLLLWWFGRLDVVSYRDDALGGVDADCEIRIRLPSGGSGRIELSRTRAMPNTCILHGTKGVLEVGTKTDSSIRFTPGDTRVVLAGKPTEAGSSSPASLADLGRREIEDFVGAIATGRQPMVSGREGRKSVALIEQCIAVRQVWDFPWESPQPSEAREAVRG